MTFDGVFFDAYQLLDTNVIQAGITMKVLSETLVPVHASKQRVAASAIVLADVQHALALFRSQRINKMTLDLKKDDDRLSVTVLSENGAGLQASMQALPNNDRALIKETELC